jgi:SAM-dependent methyltransferase
MNNDKITFSFGKNWDDFVHSCLNEERILEAIKSLSNFMGLQTLEGMTFLDIGCGSGLFSLAAYRMGAAKIVSFDFDPLSVKCCEYLIEREGNPEGWTVHIGSVLDKSFLATLGQADIVYSWGVLHHTGKMWDAIENTTQLIKPGGLMFIALYNKVEGFPGSETWLELKRAYNASPAPVKFAMEYGFIALVIIKMLITFRNPFSEIGNCKSNRGMSFRTDIRDSLGGYPYEYAFPGEIVKYCENLGLEVIKSKTVNDLSLNEFVFRRKN